MSSKILFYQKIPRLMSSSKLKHTVCIIHVANFILFQWDYSLQGRLWVQWLDSNCSYCSPVWADSCPSAYPLMALYYDIWTPPSVLLASIVRYLVKDIILKKKKKKSKITIHFQWLLSSENVRHPGSTHSEYQGWIYFFVNALNKSLTNLCHLNLCNPVTMI